PLLRYADPEIGLSERDGGCIGDAAKHRAARLLQQAWPLESRIIDEALGRVVTGNKPWLLAARPVEALEAAELVDRLDRGDRLRPAPTARFAWTRDGDQVMVFADGRSWGLEATAEPLARGLCQSGPLDPGLLSADGGTEDQALDLLTALLEQGSLEWIDDDSPDTWSGR
ncbi:MAG: winged helix domain-containing protein, partial [Gammaproteobacteria bacterium]